MSKFNIGEFRKDWGDTYVYASDCRQASEQDKLTESTQGGYKYTGPLHMETSSVYWRDIDIIKNPQNISLEQGDYPVTYHFFIDIARNSEFQPLEKYDLRVKAEDVCFQIRSAEMMRMGAKTNMVQIPKGAISAALNSDN